MKKLLVLLIAIFVMIGLVGCNSEERKTPNQWALHYVESEYESEHGSDEIFGYNIEPMAISYDDELREYRKENDLTCYLYEITIIDEGGGSHIYNVFISIQAPFLSIADKVIEEDVYFVDIEKVNSIWEERIDTLDFLIVEVVRRYEGTSLEYRYNVKYFNNNSISFNIESDDLLSVGEIGLVIEFEDETSILIDID